MGSVSAPDGLQENPNHGTPHAAQPLSGGLSRHRGDDNGHRLSIRFPPSTKKALFGNRPGLLRFLEGCLAHHLQSARGGQRIVASPPLPSTSPQRDRSGNGDAVGTPPMKPAGLNVPECTGLARRVPSVQQGRAIIGPTRGVSNANIETFAVLVQRVTLIRVRADRRSGYDGDPGSRAVDHRTFVRTKVRPVVTFW